MPPELPNILLLMTDQQRYDSLGCYGASFAHTPNLDRLAAEGVVFEHCYANNPICTPSRASLMTGKHVLDHGVCQLNDHLASGETLFPERLRARGYQTALFGKLHVSAAATESRVRHPHDGFDVYELCNEGCTCMDAHHQAYARWLEEKDPDFYQRLKVEGRGVTHVPRELHMTHWAAERTMNYLERDRDPARPFFCMMSVFEPHNPYEHYPREMVELVDPHRIPPPTPRGRGPEPSAIVRERHHNYFADFAALSPDYIAAMRHGYHASVAYGDLEFGRVLDKLASLGLAENTLVIFTSDHGDMLGDHDLLVKGAFFYDPNVRVPLIMRWPAGLECGRRTGGLVQLHDLAATILHAAGVPEETIATAMPDARNLLPLALSQENEVRDAVFCCYQNSGMCAGHSYWEPPIHATMVRSGRYKLNLWHGTGEGELFDMQQDPLEQDNVWEVVAMKKVREELSEVMDGWIARKSP